MENVILSVLLNKVYDHLKSPLVNHYKLTRKALRNLEKLSSTMSTIVSVQKDAELRQVSDHAIIDWLKKIRDAAYDVDDVLDIFATETLRRSKGADRDALLRFVSDFFSWSYNPILFRNRMGRRIKNVVDDLNGIADQRKFHLKELDGRGGVVIGYRDQTISFLDQAGLVVGRVTDKEKLVESLLRSGDGVRENLAVVAILGMGGVGKTTLAKLVYNDDRVEDKFDVRIWVCVSEDFNLNKIMRAIIEAIRKDKCELSETESLQGLLREVLGGKRFLLVLDDVWNETIPAPSTPEGVPTKWKWETLKDLLVSGAISGCKVLVTTRDENVASEMGSINTHDLGILPEDDCFSLFKLFAFGSGREENDELMAVGRRIVKKCKGLPLAVKILGGLMRSKWSIQEWLSVEDNDIWDIRRNNHDILPALKLSYNHLPLKSRFCFAYCSLFPKGYEFDMMELIQQWIANGLILPSGEKELEELGKEIFEDLLSRSLFQDPKEDDYGSILKCKIHDLIHDFARSLVEDECGIFPVRKNKVIDKKIRYFSIHEDQSSEIPKELYGAKKLRTMQSFSAHVIKINVLVDVFKKLKFLRVLNLQMTDTEDVPLSIKNLKHLRYVDFSYTRIKTLPESITCLLNLQTLRLNRCKLERLPKLMKNMSSLRNLEIKGCWLQSMPVGMEKLSNMRMLTDFTVSKDGAALKELQELKLGGELSIWKLENTRNQMDLDSANPNISSKRDLTFLNLSWTNIGNSETNRRDSDVLNALEPHSYLKKLKVVNYGGTQLPTWITKSGCHLVEVFLAYCSNCECLPPFGQLTKLKDLQLIGFSAIRSIDATFYGTNNGFASLKSLSLCDMPNFEQWLGMESGPLFPELNTLTIRDCPLLEDMPQILTLHRLDLWNCHAMILRCVANLTSLSTLLIGKIPKLKYLRVFENLTSLRKLLIVDCVDLKSFSGTMQNLTSLKHMEITGCMELKLLPNSMRYLKSLTTLNVKQCVSLTKIFKRLNQNQFTSLKSIRIVESLHTKKWRRSGVWRICNTEEFSIQICNMHTSLSLWLRYPAKLKELRIHGDHGFIRFPDLQNGNIISICCCKNLNVLPNKVQEATFLEDLVIRSCHELTDLPAKLGELNSLQSLSIIDCPSLTRLPGKLHAVQFLLISGCPLLELRCVEQGEDWPFISHIPRRNIRIPSSQ